MINIHERTLPLHLTVAHSIIPEYATKTWILPQKEDDKEPPEQTPALILCHD